MDTKLALLSSVHDPASELTTVFSICISIGSLACIYDIGQREQLHAPMVFLAFGLSVVFWIKVAAPVDIYLFVIFPWMLLVGLLISRIHGVILGSEDLPVSEEKRGSGHVFEVGPGF